MNNFIELMILLTVVVGLNLIPPMHNLGFYLAIGYLFGRFN